MAGPDFQIKGKVGGGGRGGRGGIDSHDSSGLSRQFSFVVT